MRCSAWSSLAISACSAALALPDDGLAHPIVEPPFLTAGSRSALSITIPNEREQKMTGFVVAAPEDASIVDARAPSGWDADVESPRATWRGGSLAPSEEETFHVELEAPARPGTVVLEVEQLYPDGEAVRWPISLVVLPGADTPSRSFGSALVVVLLGLMMALGGVVFLWRRRARSLPDG